MQGYSRPCLTLNCNLGYYTLNTLLPSLLTTHSKTHPILRSHRSIRIPGTHTQLKKHCVHRTRLILFYPNSNLSNWFSYSVISTSPEISPGSLFNFHGKPHVSLLDVYRVTDQYKRLYFVHQLFYNLLLYYTHYIRL